MWNLILVVLGIALGAAAGLVRVFANPGRRISRPTSQEWPWLLLLTGAGVVCFLYGATSILHSGWGVALLLLFVGTFHLPGVLHNRKLRYSELNQAEPTE